MASVHIWATGNADCPYSTSELPQTSGDLTGKTFLRNVSPNGFSLITQGEVSMLGIQPCQLTELYPNPKS